MMSNPQFRVSITHSAVTTNYDRNQFAQITVKRPENHFSTAILLANNKDSWLYNDNADNFDVLSISVKDSDETAWTEIFEGTIRQMNPTVGDAELVKIYCKGYGAALFETHCKSDYGHESSNPAIDTANEIWDDLIANHINQSLGTADNTGYTITNTHVEDLVPGTTISYINSPYDRCGDVVNKVCHLLSAIRAGSAGPHWWVDPSQNLRIQFIGTTQVGWVPWWGADNDEASSTLTQGTDFEAIQVFDKTEEFGNKIIFATDLRKPSYDYWTENQAALWGNVNCSVFEAQAGTVLVGTHAIHVLTNAGPAGAAYCYYPSAQNANWDVTQWGSERSIPRISFYYQKDAFLTGASELRLFTTDYNTNYYTVNWNSWTEPTAEWVHKSFHIGPYHASTDESRQVRWTVGGGAPDWTNIDGVAFRFLSNDVVQGADAYIDDLHFSGKVVREAQNSTSITANNEYQKLIISRTAMDDSGVAADDTGTAARYAYAELLRRQALPVTVRFTVDMRRDMLPGQQTHTHACTQVDGTYEVDATMRMTLIQHDISTDGFLTTVTATSDLLNSFPLTGVDQYELLTEYLLINNKEATDMRAAGELDILVPILAQDYP